MVANITHQPFSASSSATRGLQFSTEHDSRASEKVQAEGGLGMAFVLFNFTQFVGKSLKIGGQSLL